MNLRFFGSLALALPASVALFTACGGTADVGNDRANVNAAGNGNDTGGANGGGGIQNVPIETGGGPNAAGASQGGAAQGGAAQGGTAGGSSQGGASSGSICGGLTGAQCGTDDWCDFEDNAHCGAADATGICRPRPQACTLQYDPVCGCDGKMYGNACSANSAGTDAITDKSCIPKDGGSAPGGQCKTDADCQVVDDYCGGCNCIGLGVNESAPKCANPVACFAEPCAVNCTGGCSAHCDNGTCVAR